MTKIIWIDLDEVLAETLDQILKDNNYKLWNIETSREDILDYYIFNNKKLNITLEDGTKYFHQVYLNDTALNIEVVAWAKQKIIELKDKWYTLKIVSARPEDVANYTRKWLDKHFNDIFYSVHFANHFNYSWSEKKKRKKSEICKELWITIMVEDIFEYALDLAENWVYTYLLEKPWNKHINIKHKNIKRVMSWEEINI